MDEENTNPEEEITEPEADSNDGGIQDVEDGSIIILDQDQCPIGYLVPKALILDQRKGLVLISEDIKVFGEVNHDSESKTTIYSTRMNLDFENLNQLFRLTNTVEE